MTHGLLCAYRSGSRVEMECCKSLYPPDLEMQLTETQLDMGQAGLQEVDFYESRAPKR